MYGIFHVCVSFDITEKISENRVKNMTNFIAVEMYTWKTQATHNIVADMHMKYVHKYMGCCSVVL